jgi:rare lipoprotein A
MCAGCATAPRRGGTRSQSRHQLVGVASYYGPGFHRKKTASGERFNMYKLTAAHRTLPFGTRVKVTNIENGRSVVVRINDRGPFRKGRVIDLSLAAARKIGLVGSGTAKVRLKILR